MASRSLALLLVVAAAVVRAQSPAADADYRKAVETGRAKHEADYTRQFVPLAGLFYLDAGDNTAGSDTSNDIVLPQRAPARIGRFIYHSGRTIFEPHPAASVTLNGQRVAFPILLRADDEPQPPDELVIGEIALWVHNSGERRAIRMRDPQSDMARSFVGYRWFPIDERYRAIGKFIKDPAPRELKIPSLSGDDQAYTTEGLVEFMLNGQKLRLRPMTTRPGRLFFIFRDATSGTETYEAARFLYADLAADGTTVVDFNEAYNPPCAFNPYTTCPLPLPENRLKVRITAGERAYAGKLAKSK